MFSSTPEMIDIEVSELVQRWKPQTDLRSLVNIRNKYFYQTNVLGECAKAFSTFNRFYFGHHYHEMSLVSLQAKLSV